MPNGGWRRRFCTAASGRVDSILWLLRRPEGAAAGKKDQVRGEDDSREVDEELERRSGRLVEAAEYQGQRSVAGADILCG